MNRVLVVDDEKIIVDSTAAMIYQIGFEPLKAYSVKEALEVFKKERPGIIITDLRFNGGMDGVALCSRLRHEDDSVIMIAMSGVFSEYDKAYCRSVGFEDWLQKPIETNELLSALQCAFDRRNRWTQI